ncbi:MAG: PorT family protein [Bacteroidia bacterium]|nr:PorT family protein [Bacteroidia bacterium]
MTLSLVLVFLTVLGIQAQDVPLVDVGIKGGYTGSWIRDLGDGQTRDGIKNGYLGGVWVRVQSPLGGVFVQPEVVLAQRGSKIEDQITLDPLQGPLTGAIELTTLDVPIILGKRFNFGEDSGFRIGVGPVFSAVLKAENEAAQSFPDPDDEPGIDIEDEVQTFQAGFQAGLGLDINRLTLDVRYHHGFTHLYDDAVIIPDHRISGFQASLGIRFL